MGKTFKKLVLSLLTIACYTQADESISALLEKYEEAGKLEYKTVQEGEGHVIVFSRKDLDRMQAYTLKDVLKTIKFYHLYSDRYGNNIFNYSLLFSHYITTVRLFINNHEVSTLITRTPFSLWDNIPLDNIDHIEIYLGESAIKFGNEYASVLIKLYTKEPEKENATNIRLTKDMKKGYAVSIFDARQTKSGISYMVMLNQSKIDRKTLDRLSRDKRINYGYFQFRYHDVLIEAAQMKKKSDIFLATSLDNDLDAGNEDAQHRYFSISTSLLSDKSLKLNFSFDDIRYGAYERDENGVLGCVPDSRLIFKLSDTEVKETSHNFFIQKSFDYKENNQLFLAAIYKNREALIDKKGVLITNSPIFIKNHVYEDYLSFLVQNETRLRNNMFIVVGMRYDRYDRPSGFKDMNGFMLKAEIVQKLKYDIYYKIFGGSFFVPTSFMEVLNNPNLRKQKNKLITVELEKRYKKSDVIFAFGKTYIQNGVYFDVSSLSFRNLDEDVDFTFYSVYAKFKFSDTGKILIDAFKIDPSETVLPFSSREGAGLHVFENLGNFDFYFGLIYRSGFTFNNVSVDDGFDLTLSARYRVNDKLYIGIRGENLLDKSLKIPYVGISNVKFYPTLDRKIYISMVSSF